MRTSGYAGRQTRAGWKRVIRQPVSKGKKKETEGFQFLRLIFFKFQKKAFLCKQLVKILAMKRHLLWLLFLCTGVVGCMENKLPDSIDTASAIPVQFTLNLRTEVLPFPAARRSMPDLSLPEPTLPGSASPAPPDSPGGDQDLSELCTHLEYLVYRGEETELPLKHKQFTIEDTDMDFGIVYDSLPAGNYRFVFIAHSSEETEFSAGAARFDEVSDMFYASEKKTIDASSESQAVDVSLRRPVCRIEFVSTDPVTADLKDFEIRVSQYPEGLHMATGFGTTATVTQAFLHTFTAEETGKTACTHSFYTFIPPETGTLDISLTASNRQGEITRQRKITGITPLPNRIIRYSGRLYAPPGSDDTFRLDVYEGGKWEATEEVELPD